MQGPLKVFLWHQMRSIVFKEWWDFVVDLKTTNTNHVPMLYPVANLCPSFKLFLKSKKEEINYILRKRPVIKPRIFSGSKRPSELPPSSTVTSPPKLSCSAELDKILNELYSNDKSIIKKNSELCDLDLNKREPSIKKLQSVQYKKNLSTQESPEISTSTCSNFLGENNSVTAFRCHKRGAFNKTQCPCENDNSSVKENKTQNARYGMPDLYVSKNKIIDIKPKKKIKGKRKRCNNKGKFNSKRTRFVDKTPELKTDWVEKYKMKKCFVNLIRLSRNEIKEAMQSKPKTISVIFHTTAVKEETDILENKQSEMFSSSNCLSTFKEIDTPSVHT